MTESNLDSDFEDTVSEDDGFGWPDHASDFLEDKKEKYEEEEEEEEEVDSALTSMASSTRVSNVSAEDVALVDNTDMSNNTKERKVVEEKKVESKRGVEPAVNKSILRDEWPLRRSSRCPWTLSLFDHVPKSIHFCHFDEKHEEQRLDSTQLKWQLTRLTPVVVRRVVSNSGFELLSMSEVDKETEKVEQNEELGVHAHWIGVWGKHMRRVDYERLRRSQKVNHFPGGVNLARKDRLWKHHLQWRQARGMSSFGFMPNSFCLPKEAEELKRIWRRKGPTAKWIVKPPAMARGLGIHVVSKWREIPSDRELVVQEYISRPHLIRGLKYDLRLYVLLTSVEPLRVFLYDEGLVRFASKPYQTDVEQLSDVFMHLTNFSVNRENTEYFVDGKKDKLGSKVLKEESEGFKWRLSTLRRHFEQELKLDWSSIWTSIKSLVVKTIISVVSAMRKVHRNHVHCHYNCYELFGFDVLIDAHLKAWLLEVNLSPSLHSSSLLDLEVKAPLVTEMLNMVRFHLPNDHVDKLYSKSLSETEREKQSVILEMNNEDNLDVTLAILDDLTPDDVRHLIRAEDELALSHNFKRIFPVSQEENNDDEKDSSNDCHHLFLMVKDNYYDLLMHAWEHKYGREHRQHGVQRLKELCRQRYHLQ